MKGLCLGGKPCPAPHLSRGARIDMRLFPRCPLLLCQCVVDGVSVVAALPQSLSGGGAGGRRARAPSDRIPPLLNPTWPETFPFLILWRNWTPYLLARLRKLLYWVLWCLCCAFVWGIWAAMLRSLRCVLWQSLGCGMCGSFHGHGSVCVQMGN